MRPRMTVLATVMMAFGLALAGCGHQARTPSGSQPGADAAGPGLSAAEVRREDAVTAWADQYCGAVSELVHSFSRMPQIDPSSPERAAVTSSELLDVMVAGLDRTIERLDRLDAAPVAGADRVKEVAVDTYTGIRDRAVGAKQQLEAAATPQASQAALSSMRKPLEDLGGVNLLGGFDSVPGLRDASMRAPACTQLTEKGPAPSFDATGKPRS